MRKIFAVLAVLSILFLTAGSVSAATSASSMSTHCTVAADGSCQVSISVTVRLEEAVQKLTFPVPAEATGVTLNGSRVGAAKSGQVRNVDLRRITGNAAGTFTFNIHYSLHDVIHITEAGLLEMQVPLMSGFAYPVQALSFSVTLPGATGTLPGFVSGYHHANIEKDITYLVEGATISGSAGKELKDHETLMMTMIVSEEMFPQSIVKRQDSNAGAVAMGVCAGLALLYWLITMLNFPTWPMKAHQLPQGTNAGQLGCVLGMRGLDLSMMVIHWAQLGYLTVRVERGKLVTLCKRMEMGNERAEYEQRLFKALFGRKNTVNTQDFSYAALYIRCKDKTAGMQEYLKRFNGSGKIFRSLASGIGLFGGGSLGIMLGGGAVLQWLMILVLAVFGLVSGWYMQDWVSGWVLRDKSKLTRALVLSGFWLLLGLLAESFALAAWMVAGILIAGGLLFWGGRRTAAGVAAREQLFALRRYLCRLDKATLQSLCAADPDYFFRMAPVALALGVDRQFARQFGAMRFAGCPYLSTGVEANMTALQWNAMMRKSLDMMDKRAKQLPMEKWIRLIRSITKG